MPPGGSGFERRAVEREQGVQHLEIVRGRVQQGGRGGGDRVGQRVDIVMHRVQHRAGGVAAGKLRRAQRAVAVGERRRALLERVKGIEIRANERVALQAAQHGKRAQAQGKGGKLHICSLLVQVCCSVPAYHTSAGVAT